MKEQETLTPKQIENWRRIMVMQGFGAFALICPNETVIGWWQKMKAMLERRPEVKDAREQERRVTFEDDESKKWRPKPKKVCSHGNSITGNKGKYCLDCEKYV
jgi:hypothetical protein